jgi:uncharacterized protein (DUF697 family)
MVLLATIIAEMLEKVQKLFGATLPTPKKDGNIVTQLLSVSHGKVQVRKIFLEKTRPEDIEEVKE